MFTIRNYFLLINLCLLTDEKYKVAVISSNVKYLQNFTRTAADLSFKSTLISTLLIEDSIYIYIRKILIKAKS